jgi:hypothetical protein
MEFSWTNHVRNEEVLLKVNEKREYRKGKGKGSPVTGPGGPMG